MAQLSVFATKYVRVPAITAFDPNTDDAADPTSTPIQFAFLARGVEPADSDWVDAEWVGSGVGPQDARVLVGPNGSVALPVGKYVVWWQAIGALEQPVKHSGLLVIT